ncbi:MAG: UDP-2,3-diacylglucosamine diphosphatase, partial [Flavobacteriaceae bacterium]|nr:UDP-2,3-diacylglucosamine diphosphatase [Flavobacteriaceae bacterium]
MKKNIYFASDNHLGAPDNTSSLVRERLFVKWLGEIKPKAKALFILGDLFDVWFEYKTVVPKGFVRVLGKLAEFSDEGIEIHYFVGNHDMWMIDYLEKEIGAKVYFNPQVIELGDKLFFIGHGDGLGPNDKGYKRMKKLFRSPFFQWLYRWIHPDIGIRFARYLSLKNKMISGPEDLNYDGPDKEWLAQYSKRKLEEKHYDYFVFGHRHLPLEISLNEKSTYINVGDWISHYTYAIFDGRTLSLKH